MAYTTLVSTETLHQNLQNPNWVIFDCRSSLVDHQAGLLAFQAGHIPEARYCHLEDNLSSPITDDSGRHPLPDFDKLVTSLGNWGVDKDTQVVVYDDAGGAYAVRLWWQLRTFGHFNVAVLDGGFQQWEKGGKPLSRTLAEITPKTFIPNTDTTQWLPTEIIEQNLSDKKYTLLDARTPERFRGEAEPIDRVAGRIPNSINRAFQLNLNEEGLFLSAQELRQQYDELLGDIAPQDIVHLCGSGVTACHNTLAMEIAGLPDSKLYIGSWSEWIRDDKRPIATG